MHFSYIAIFLDGKKYIYTNCGVSLTTRRCGGYKYVRRRSIARLILLTAWSCLFIFFCCIWWKRKWEILYTYRSYIRNSYQSTNTLHVVTFLWRAVMEWYFICMNVCNVYVCVSLHMGYLSYIQLYCALPNVCVVIRGGTNGCLIWLSTRISKGNMLLFVCCMCRSVYVTCGICCNVFMYRQIRTNFEGT